MEFLEKFGLLAVGLVLALIAINWFLVAVAPIKTKKEKWIVNLGFAVILLLLVITNSPLIPENPWQRAILLITIAIVMLMEIFKKKGVEVYQRRGGFDRRLRVLSGGLSAMSGASPNKSFKPLAYGSLGHSALRTCSGMASPLFPEQALRAECRLTWR